MGQIILTGWQRDEPDESCPNCGRHEVRKGEGYNSKVHEFQRGWVISLLGAEDNEVIKFCPFCGHELPA